MDDKTIIDTLPKESINILENKLNVLSKSKFRSSFHLHKKEYNYLKEKGFKEIENHAFDFINKNLAPAIIPNDGKQTPTKNHPVFIARHATATCCRSCLEKWHHITKGRELKENEKRYIVSLIILWLKKESSKNE